MRPDLQYHNRALDLIAAATRQLVDAGYGKEESVRALACAAVISWVLVDERPIDDLVDEIRQMLAEAQDD